MIVIIWSWNGFPNKEFSLNVLLYLDNSTLLAMVHKYIYYKHDVYRFISATNWYTSWPSLCHLSPGSSMVRASHRRSEGCGFDSRLGLRNIFLSLR